MRRDSGPKTMSERSLSTVSSEQSNCESNGGFIHLIILTIAGLVIGAILLLGYMGFIPIVSGFFGSNQPRELGVEYTNDDLNSANEKTGVQLISLSEDTPDSQSLQYFGVTKIKASFSDKELTALIANGKWKFHPVTNTQLKINPDDTVEVAGILRLDRIHGFAAAYGITESEVDAAFKKIRFITNNPAFYAKGRLTVENNVFKIDLVELWLGRLKVPLSWFSDYMDKIDSFISDRLKFIPGIGVRSAKFENGLFVLDTDFPAIEATVHAKD